MTIKSRLSLLLASVLLLWPLAAHANPTQYGDSGLLSQPTAETLNAGNICLGLWGNFASDEEQDATVIPFSITLGLGTFLEMYGSYPNLLFNGDEDASGRGFANLGMKIRLLGTRSSPFKLAIDGQGRRMVSDDPAFDGLTDYAGRLIASFKPGRFGIHANVGYVSVDDPEMIDFENQTVYGGGIEFFPTARLRLIAEMESVSERLEGMEDLREATLGFQYFISPHLTINLGVGMGLTDASPDWRLLAGFSACQGVGSYSKPVPRIIEPAQEEAKGEPAEPVKVIKVRTLTPLIPKSAPVETVPVSRLEIPVEFGEEAVVQLSEKLVIPVDSDFSSLPIAPISAAFPAGAETFAATSGAELSGIPVDESTRLAVYRKFLLPEVSFANEQWDLSEEGKKAIGEIAEQLRKEDRPFIIKVEGHTDSIGSEKYNNELSAQRAISAATCMAINNGIDPSRMFVKGYGESKPIAPNLSADGRTRNSRIEVLLLLPKERTP